MTDTQAVTCPLCQRPLDDKVTRHHLYPQKIGRKKGHKAHAKEFPVVSLHKICHRMIHALFSEKYLAAHLNTVVPRIYPGQAPKLRCARAKKQGKEAKRSARNIAVAVAITPFARYINIQLI